MTSASSPSEVLFRDEVAAILRCSPRQVKGRIPELLPRLDRHPRYARQAVDAYLRGEGTRPAGRRYFTSHKREASRVHETQRRAERVQVQFNPTDQPALNGGAQ